MDACMHRLHYTLQEQEYQVLSDLPGAMEGLGPEHGLSLSMQQHWEQCRLSNATVAPDIVADTLLFWRDAMSPYSLVHFEDLADLGAPQVGLLWCAQIACQFHEATFADDVVDHRTYTLLHEATFCTGTCSILWVCIRLSYPSCPFYIIRTCVVLSCKSLSPFACHLIAKA